MIGGTTARYAERRGRAPLADVVLPQPVGPHPPGAAGVGPHPSAVIVHGGGFLGGNRRMRAVRTVRRALVGAGYAVATFDYRLPGRGASLDDALDDLHAMVRWWRARRKVLRLDPDRVSVIGLSAGAALATMIPASLGRLHRLAAIYGPVDFSILPPWVPRALLRTRDPEVWRGRSPTLSCDVDVPLLLQHGVQDGIVPVEHSVRLARARRERGLPVEAHYYDGIGHGFYRHPELPVTQHALRDLLSFLR